VRKGREGEGLGCCGKERNLLPSGEEGADREGVTGFFDSMAGVQNKEGEGTYQKQFDAWC
jgi:hypothetical protein